ncbi:actin, putative [Entamoeba invadens IP1]|uniref:actin, putative n=1 Tax=Entamoeba invadens IP1 TaxID=370355 RepID=UPI0002C3EFCB|nr:actin, putative [Entamoeba invadens IP1]ELP94238.1 actin, putative [Entamoeba invadens IP1]|eukprot:XP_004261009.1 actin, putative [Entamoeba invadens IP1]
MNDERNYVIFLIIEHSQLILEQPEAIIYGVLKIVCPIEQRKVKNWSALESVWAHAFKNDLGVNPKDHPLPLTEDFEFPYLVREKMSQLAFEKFEVPSFHLNVLYCCLFTPLDEVSALLLRMGNLHFESLWLMGSHLHILALLKFSLWWPKQKVRIHPLSERKYSKWIGRTKIASLSIFREMSVIRQQYEKCGPSVVLHKNISIVK